MRDFLIRPTRETDVPTPKESDLVAVSSLAGSVQAPTEPEKRLRDRTRARSSGPVGSNSEAG